MVSDTQDSANKEHHSMIISLPPKQTRSASWSYGRKLLSIRDWTQRTSLTCTRFVMHFPGITGTRIYNPRVGFDSNSWNIRSGRPPVDVVNGMSRFIEGLKLHAPARNCPPCGSPTCIKLTASFGLDAKLFTRIAFVYRDRCEQSLE